MVPGRDRPPRARRARDLRQPEGRLSRLARRHHDQQASLVAKQGELRDGGSYETRMSNIAVWNSVMDEHQYLVSKWNEFLAS